MVRFDFSHHLKFINTQANSTLPLMASLEFRLFWDEYGQDFFIRGITHDGRQVFSVYDFINLTCEMKKTSSFGYTTFFHLTREESEYKEELCALVISCKLLTGQDFLETPCMTVQGLSVLLQKLGDRISNNWRTAIGRVLNRYLGGDLRRVKIVLSERHTTTMMQVDNYDDGQEESENEEFNPITQTA